MSLPLLRTPALCCSRVMSAVECSRVVSARTKMTSEHYQRGRTLNKYKYWGRLVEDGEGTVPGRSVARIRNVTAIWPGANVQLVRNKWENILRAKAMGQVRYHTEVVDGKERMYCSIDRIYAPRPRFLLTKTIPKEENLAK